MMSVWLPLVLLWLERDEDREFLTDVYTRLHHLMYAQALRITHSSEGAEDAVSDSLMVLMKKSIFCAPFHGTNCVPTLS